jgi:pimeloyl-ACP methyl ester carboxylesterase
MARSTGWAAILVLLSLVLPAGLSRADGPAAHTFTAKGVKVRYFVSGKGQPVVLLHGLLSSAWINWDLPGITAALARHHQVITLDLRGHGGSDKPDKAEAYGIELVEDVVRLLDHLKIKKVHVVGYSMGGMVAVKFMTKHPDRVLSGTLGGMGWLRDGSALHKVWGQLWGRKASGAGAECARSLGKLAVTEEEIKGIRVPVVLLVGDRDPCKQLYVEPLQKVRKDGPVIEIADAGHFNCIFKPRFKEEIQKWLAKQAQR